MNAPRTVYSRTLDFGSRTYTDFAYLFYGSGAVESYNTFSIVPLVSMRVSRTFYFKGH